VLVAAVFLLGVLTAAFHSHTDSSAEQGCVVCALAHSAADTPAVVAVPSATIVELRIEPVTGTLAPSCAPRRGTSSRAPPLS
jgi:hypothetical protein